jgi:hypothetical protein
MKKKNYKKQKNEEIDEDVFLEESLTADSSCLEEELEENDFDSKKTKHKKPPSDKETHYVDPKQFDDEIIKFYDNGVISNDLAEMISKISNKLSYAPNFINYTFRDEMVGDGIVRMFKALTAKKYTHTKGSNPFSYFTRIAFNAFRNRIKKEKHSRETLEKYQEEVLMTSSNYNTVIKNSQVKITKDRDY